MRHINFYLSNRRLRFLQHEVRSTLGSKHHDYLKRLHVKFISCKLVE